MQPYTDEFYRELQEEARRSARVIVPLILEWIQPKSVIDVGCGLGTWLDVFQEHGIEDVWGMDSEHVDKTMLEIPEERFRSCDLVQPFSMEQQCDLVLSLEVAEHLPSHCAATFIDCLTKLGPFVVFSAAIPFQSGIHHVNEQWPEYWAELFLQRGYVAIDCLRRKIWDNERVAWWYAQNILLFTTQAQLEHHPRLKMAYEFAGTSQLSLVHPKKYLACIEWGLSQYASCADGHR